MRRRVCLGMELHRIIEEGSDSDFKWICLHPHSHNSERQVVSLDGFPTFTAISHLYSGKEKKFSTFCNSRRWFRVKTMTNGSSPKPSLTNQRTLKELKIVFHTLLHRLMIAAWLWESSCMVFHVCVGTCEHVCTSLCPGSEKGAGGRGHC